MYNNPSILTLFERYMFCHLDHSYHLQSSIIIKILLELPALMITLLDWQESTMTNIIIFGKTGFLKHSIFKALHFQALTHFGLTSFVFLKPINNKFSLQLKDFFKICTLCYPSWMECSSWKEVKFKICKILKTL